jgi:CDP-diacylglycerol--serine O-phosphatidyltransferase
VLLGIFFDFFDGLIARLLNVQGELGKQLDSLADLVTSGVAPGVVMYKLLESSQENTHWFNKLSCTIGSWAPMDDKTIYFFPFIGLLLTLAAAYRLANFNIDERQVSSFIGVPTPAMALFIISLPLIQMYSDNILAINLIKNKYFLIAVTIIFSLLMNANFELFSLKFKQLSLKENWVVYLFLVIAVILIVLFKFVAIPVIITLYILLSLIKLIKK